MRRSESDPCPKSNTPPDSPVPPPHRQRSPHKPRKPTVRQVITRLITISLTTTALASNEPTTIDDWARETIPLPPGFAPDFPSGVEELRFPPGWRNPDSDNYWSYAIEMKLDEPAPSKDQLADLLKTYYTGLMEAFGVGRKPDSPPNEVTVEIEELAPNTYRATLHLIDGFSTLKPKSVLAQIETHPDTETTSTITIRISPHPIHHEIWTDLTAALVHINAERLNQHTAPLKPLAHLPQGEWRTVPENENQQRDRWTWAAGKNALISITTNKNDNAEAIFGVFTVIYHHPQRDELTVLALVNPGLIQNGTVTPQDDHILRFDMTLSYNQEYIHWAPKSREISSLWTFDTPTSYTNHWIQDDGQPVDPNMTNWSYTKADTLTPFPPSTSKPPKTIEHLKHFLPLIEHDWETDTTRTTFTWIPHNEALHMRTTDKRTHDPIEDTIFYPHPHTNTIHTLTIHESGAIDEGTVVSMTPSSIEIAASRATTESRSPLIRQLSITESNQLRDHVSLTVEQGEVRITETRSTPINDTP